MTQCNVVVDISDYQVNPNFAVAAEELVGVIVKATEGVKGQWATQKNYSDKITKARAAGLLVGSYHFGRPGSGADQARYFLDTVGDPSGQLLALDCEGIYSKGVLIPSRSMTLAEAQEFVAYVKNATGNWPGIYCGNDYLIPLLGGKPDGVLSNCWLWLADYNKVPAWPKSVWPSLAFWQYTGDGEGLEPHDADGIGKNIDRDIFFGDIEELRAFWTSHAASRKAATAAVPHLGLPKLATGLKTLVHPITGRAFKMGRKRPIARGPRFKLANYLMRNLPTPPESTDYSVNAPDFLALVLGNDQLGDCTAAGAFHIGAVLLGGAGAPITFGNDDVIAFYSATTGYVPDNPSTDQGGDEQTVLNYWQQNGLQPGQHQIAGWLSVNGNDQTEMKAALWLMENLYFGLELPDAWVNPMPSGPDFIWDVAGAPDPNNGHCFVGIGYNSDGVIIDTWGMLGVITWAAIAKYATTAGQGELYTVLGPDGISSASGKAPAGFDWSQLVADFDSMGGTVPAPAAGNGG